MSELTQCNFCALQQIKEEAKRKGLKVVLLPSSYSRRSKFFRSGTSIFVVPKSISIKDIKSWKDCFEAPPNGDENYKKYQKCWMDVISNRCVC